MAKAKVTFKIVRVAEDDWKILADYPGSEQREVTGLTSKADADEWTIPHKQMIKAFELRPNVGFAIWRETLIDGAIFREAITNNSARPPTVRMAHFFCELFYRAKAAGITDDQTLDFPVLLPQLADTLGMALATVNRSLSDLRDARALDFRLAKLTISDWKRLTKVGQFSPSYLHLRRPPSI